MRWSAQYKFAKPTDFVRVGDRLLPRSFTLSSHNDLPWPEVRVRFELEDGAYQCREVTLTAADGGREVNSVDLRRVRVDDLLELGVDIVGMVVDDGDGFVTVSPPATVRERDETVRLARQARAGRKLKMTGEFLREAAEVYQANLGEAPTQAVADHFDRSLRSASLYIKRARAAGLLGDHPAGEDRP